MRAGTRAKVCSPGGSGGPASEHLLLWLVAVWTFAGEGDGEHTLWQKWLQFSLRGTSFTERYF